MDLVTIYHPVLDRETNVHPDSVPHWRLSGWQEGPRPEPPEQANTAEPTHAPRRRRATERSE